MNLPNVDLLVKTFSRISPIIITHCPTPEKQILLNELTARLEHCVFVENVESPKKLFQLFVENNGMTLIFHKEDLLIKRKNYIDILEGAFCSSPDSGDLWQVNYEGQKSFKFIGKIIICTALSKEEIISNEKLEYIARDGMKL